MRPNWKIDRNQPAPDFVDRTPPKALHMASGCMLAGCRLLTALIGIALATSGVFACLSGDAMLIALGVILIVSGVWLILAATIYYHRNGRDVVIELMAQFLEAILHIVVRMLSGIGRLF